MQLGNSKSRRAGTQITRHLCELEFFPRAAREGILPALGQVLTEPFSTFSNTNRLTLRGAHFTILKFPIVCGNLFRDKEISKLIG